MSERNQVKVRIRLQERPERGVEGLEKRISLSTLKGGWISRVGILEEVGLLLECKACDLLTLCS